MSILDTFYILFDSDASKLNKGLDESDKRAKQTTESIKATDAAAYKMGQSIGTAIKELGGLVLGYVAARALVASFNAATDAADKLNESTERLGLNIETVSAWGDLVTKNGGSAEAFTGSIDQLNKGLAMMEVTGKSRVAPFLEELGIDLDAAANKGKTAMDFLLPIAAAFEGMDRQKSSAVGAKLGLDPGTILTLQSGRKEVEALLEKEKELGVITKRQGEIADKFGDTLDDTRHAIRSLWLSMSESILPVLTRITEGFQTVALFMRKHSHFVLGLLGAIAAGIAVLVVPALWSMAAAAIVAFAPFLLVGAVIAGIATIFALLYDDVMNFLEGNDSLLGQILEAWPMLGDAVMGVVEVVKTLGEVVGWTFGTMVDLLQIAFNLWQRMIAGVYEFSGVAALVNFIIDGWKGQFKGLGEIVMLIWDAIIAKVQQAVAVISSAIGLVRGVAGAISGALGSAKVSLGINTPTPAGLNEGRAAIAAAGASPLAAQTSNSISNQRGGDRSIAVTTGPIAVHTQATDAAGISKALGGTVDSQMRQAVAHYDDGVAA